MHISRLYGILLSMKNSQRYDRYGPIPSKQVPRRTLTQRTADNSHCWAIFFKLVDEIEEYLRNQHKNEYANDLGEKLHVARSILPRGKRIFS